MTRVVSKVGRVKNATHVLLTDRASLYKTRTEKFADTISPLGSEYVPSMSSDGTETVTLGRTPEYFSR